MLSTNPDPFAKPGNLFEAMMGMTAEEWDALGVLPDADDDEPRLTLD